MGFKSRKQKRVSFKNGVFGDSFCSSQGRSKGRPLSASEVFTAFLYGPVTFKEQLEFLFGSKNNFQ